LNVSEIIPEDVMKAALAVRAQLCTDDVCALPAGCGCLDAIAAAILAERDRCYDLAEIDMLINLSDRIPADAAKQVLAAIRNAP
jgi:hypothetical protein